MHDWYKKTLQENITASPAATIEKNQRKLEDTVSTPSNVANYRRIFVTALHFALKEKHLSDFEDLIELQQKNGLKCLQWKYHEKVCAQFTEILTDTLKKVIQ